MVDNSRNLDSEQDRDYIEIKIPSQNESIPSEKVNESVVDESSTLESDEVNSSEKLEKKPVVKKKVAKKKVAKKKVAKKKVAKKKVAKSKKKTAKKPVTSVVKPNKRKKKQRDLSWLWALLLILGLVIIAGVIYLSFNPTVMRGDNNDSVVEKTSEVSGADSVAVLVNNQPIYVSDIDEIFSQLPEKIRAQTSKELILEQLIDQEVLRQEAENIGLVVKEADIESFLTKFKLMNGMDDATFESELAKRNLDIKEFKEEIKKQILITNLLNKSVLSDLDVSEEDVVSYYNNNKEFFKTPEADVVKHILISPEENESDEDVLSRAEAVKDLINEDFSNFCDLVTEYSQDSGSINTCGKYVVSQDGRYVPEFENAALSLKINEVNIVKTTFGYHIIWKVSHQEAGNISLDDARDRIKELLIQEQTNLAVRDYVSNLREQATIEKYPLEEQAVVTAPAPAAEEEVIDKERQVDVEPTQPARESDFGKCLAEKNVILYGVYWSPDVTAQKEMLGDALDKINYVECDPKDGVAPDSCTNISIYPTWSIGTGDEASILTGKQSLNALELATGCSA